MKSKTIRRWSFIHTWTSLICTVFLLLLALTGLTQALGTNERKLTELFRRRVGLTVFDYFGEMRLETGRRLLEGSDIRIQLIADRVGYRNAGDFTRAFRRRYGVTPREYRQARGGSEDDEA